MLHERTVPLTNLDAVAVRDESDTLVLYSERLTSAQRAGLRLYLLEVLEQEVGPTATVVVAAGATEQVLAGARASSPAVAPMGVVAAVLVTLVAVLVAAAFVAAVVVLIVEVQPGGEGGDARRPGPLVASASRPAPPPTGAAELAGPPSVTPREEPSTGGQSRAPEQRGDVLRTVQRVVPTLTPPPTSVGCGGLLELPEVELPNVDLPDVDLPSLGLPDVDLPGASPDESEESDDPEDDAESDDGDEPRGSGDSDDDEDAQEDGAPELDVDVPGESDE